MPSDEPFIPEIVEKQLADLESPVDHSIQDQTHNSLLIKHLQQIYHMQAGDTLTLARAKQRILQQVQAKEKLPQVIELLAQSSSSSVYPKLKHTVAAQPPKNHRRLYLLAALLFIGCLSLAAIFLTFPLLHYVFPSNTSVASLNIGIETQPLLYQHNLYINDGNDIHAYAAGDGAPGRTYTLPTNPDTNTAGNGSAEPLDTILSFTIGNGILYMSGEALTSATRMSDGKVLWQAPFGRSVLNSTIGSVIYGYTRHTIYALRADDGKLLWQYPLAEQHEVPNAPLAVQGTVYFSAFIQLNHAIDARIYALNAADGILQWVHILGHAAISDLQTDGLRLYIFVDGSAEALRTSDGAVLWHHKLPFSSALEMSNTSLKMVTHGVVYVAGGDGSIYALQVASGQLLWRYEALSGTQFGSLSVQGNAVYIGMLAASPFQPRASLIVALQNSNGLFLWQKQLSEQDILSPIASQGTVYTIVETNGQEALFALRTDVGRLLWQRTLSTLA